MSTKKQIRAERDALAAAVEKAAKRGKPFRGENGGRWKRKAKQGKKPDSGPWLAGVLQKSKTGLFDIIHYVSFHSAPRKPGWTPYAAMAERFTKRDDAILAARTAAVTFNVKRAVPVLQTEAQAFTKGGLECEEIKP